MTKREALKRVGKVVYYLGIAIELPGHQYCIREYTVLGPCEHARDYVAVRTPDGRVSQMPPPRLHASPEEAIAQRSDEIHATLDVHQREVRICHNELASLDNALQNSVIIKELTAPKEKP